MCHGLCIVCFHILSCPNLPGSTQQISSVLEFLRAGVPGWLSWIVSALVSHKAKHRGDSGQGDGHPKTRLGENLTHVVSGTLQFFLRGPPCKVACFSHEGL